ncbi:MAG: TonB-dependent receptor [Chitinophagales bacterium]
MSPNYLSCFQFLFFACILPFSLSAQNASQSIYGQVVDKLSKEALVGASIVILDSDPFVGTTSDLEGKFTLDNVPVGRVSLQVSYLGYEVLNYPEIIISSGKALNLNIDLAESVKSIGEIVVNGKRNSSTMRVQNEMATVSAMSFTLEQSTRYAGSLNDPSRLVLSFPGVRNQGDVQNGISVRGNTPSGLLWSIQGLELQSPNHFARDGSLGAVNMINSNLLQGVDFYTAAFPAQYGNAGSGVFDLKMRKGNSTKYEFSLAAGTLGMEASAEGPFSKKSEASFLFSYRYSTLGLLSAVGYSVGGNSAPGFQDFNYKINLPTKKLGVFEFFGLVGDSKIKPLKVKANEGDWSDSYRMGVLGIQNSLKVSAKTHLTSSLMYSQSKGAYYNEGERPRYNNSGLVPVYKGKTLWEESFPIIERRLQADLKSTTKISAKHSFESGLNLSYIQLNQEFKRSASNYNYNSKQDVFILKSYQADSSIALAKTAQIKAFLQHKLRLTEALSFTIGIHAIHSSLMKFTSIEPRLGMNYRFGNGHALNAGFGMHSRLEPLAFYANESKYFDQVDLVNFTAIEAFGSPNKRLGASRSIHFVLGNNLQLADQLKLKTELYLQYLYAIPVRKFYDPFDQFSTINFQYPSLFTYNFEFQEVYANKGKGLNYGIDISLEKAFIRNYYILLNASYYQSKYNTPSTQDVYQVKWLNTRYNGNFIFSATAGKDFEVGKEKNNRISMNFRSIWAGNNRSYTFDFYAGEKPFEKKLANYFRLDTRIAYTRNKEKYSWTLSLDIQNASNRINAASNPQINSTGIIPFLNYKVDF